MIEPISAHSSRHVSAVKDIFSRITPWYDLMNRLMSARRDVAWRRHLVRRIPRDAALVLDVATGTGDVALEIVRQRHGARVVGVDFVPRMIEFARVKSARSAKGRRVFFALGDALRLPFADGQFDAAAIAFGLRNIIDRKAALKEMLRAVKPGGKIFILEMTFPRNLGLRRFFDLYLNRVIPILGRFIARNAPAYRYLPDSIQNFLHPDALKEMMLEAGCCEVTAIPLTFGITCLHEGTKPTRDGVV